MRPGGAQVCDGVNNNCSAPGWPGLAGTNEMDDDGDSQSECQSDCNDANGAVRPGAAQVCDGVNNNCSAPGWPLSPRCPTHFMAAAVLPWDWR